jgi:hypothetical protein
MDERLEHMCVKCGRNTAGTSRVRLRENGVFILSMHAECAFDLPWTVDAVAEEPAPEKENIHMTSKDQITALAVFCGIGQIKDGWGWDFTGIEHPGDMPSHVKVPDYLNDLDAVRKVELNLDDEEWLEYMLQACDVMRIPSDMNKWTIARALLSMSAKEKCEAILKALSLWNNDIGN